MLQSLLIALNLKQNSINFKLKPIKNQPLLFKYKFVFKVLNLLNNNPEDLKAVIVKCLFIKYK
jgi:hypothetical protein